LDEPDLHVAGLVPLGGEKVGPWSEFHAVENGAGSGCCDGRFKLSQRRPQGERRTGDYNVRAWGAMPRRDMGAGLSERNESDFIGNLFTGDA